MSHGDKERKTNTVKEECQDKVKPRGDGSQQHQQREGSHHDQNVCKVCSGIYDDDLVGGVLQKE